MTAPWRSAEIRVNGEAFAFPFEELVGVSRAALVAYLAGRCEAEGVVLRHGAPIADVAALDADLVIGADGVTSVVRAAGDFGESSVLGDNRFAWLGSREALPAMRLTFDQTPHGMLLTAAYPYAADRSTLIVESSEACWRGLALADTLCDRFPLVDTPATWRQFRAVRTRRLVHGRLALVGDAGASMYYALGAGTMLAVRGAAMLATLVCRAPSLAAGLAAYDREARGQLDAVQQASEIDLRAMAQLDRLPPLDPSAFAHAYVRRFG